MKQVFNSGGQITVAEIPSPACGENEVLVQNYFSVISAGTESTSVKQGTKGITGLISSVTHNPALIRQALNMTRKEGLGKTWHLVRRQAEGQLKPLGYSSSGIVLEVGPKISDISVGDRVACAGAGYANHAEIIVAPRNLICIVPESVDFDEAAFTTLGAIALQGIRRAQVQIGDRVVVIGLGLLGQVACQILKAAGASVIGIDPLSARTQLAADLGADVSLIAGEGAVSAVLRHTRGAGADAVLIYASTPSSEPVRQAMEMARKKGRVVVVGAVGMELDRSPFYEKELDFLISCSYGPGRYDPLYEEKGMDYPIGFVRWTENRNLLAFLELLAQKKVRLKSLISRVFPIEEAPQAYQALEETETKLPAVLFQYAAGPRTETPRIIGLKPLNKIGGKINVAVIGAGFFGGAYHLPNLKRLPGYHLRAIVTRTGGHAKSLSEKYRAQYFSTDYEDVLKDPAVDMVLIATRHNLHAPLVIEAAKAGKNIFVEKPLAMTYAECRQVSEQLDSSRVNLVVGFNRRFSPLARTAIQLIRQTGGPLVINIRVNSSGLDRHPWINDPEEGGGAILGEACHFFDFAGWLVGAEPQRIYAEMISSDNSSTVNANNIVSTLRYADGSIASLTYTTLGHADFPKERIEIFIQGGVILIDDFKELVVTGLAGRGMRLSRPQKGQFELLQEYGLLLSGHSPGTDLPGVKDGLRATICALKALDALKTGKIQEFNYPW